MPVVWLWLVMALVGTGVTIRNLRRAQRRAKIERRHPADHPVRMLAEARVRDKWLHLVPFSCGVVLGLLVLGREWLPFHIPSGLSIAEILLLMGVMVAVQVLEDVDDHRINWQWPRKQR